MRMYCNVIISIPFTHCADGAGIFSSLMSQIPETLMGYLPP